MINRFGGPATIKAKRNKRVRKPGDDEFGLQPRLTREKTAGNKKQAGRKAGNRTKGRRGGNAKGSRIKGKDTIEQIRTNAGVFLRSCDSRPWAAVPHSAKTEATLRLVKEW